MGSASLQELCGLVGSLCPLSPLRAEEPTRLRRTERFGAHTGEKHHPFHPNQPTHPTSQPTKHSIIKQPKDLEHLCPSSLTILANQCVPTKKLCRPSSPTIQTNLFQTNSTQTSYLNLGYITQSSSSFTLSQRYHPQSFVPIIPGIHHPLLNWMPCNAM